MRVIRVLSAACLVLLGAVLAGQAAAQTRAAKPPAAAAPATTGSLQTAAAQPPKAQAPKLPVSSTPAVVASSFAFQGDKDRQLFTLELDRVVAVEAFTLADPYRVVVELPEIRFALPTDAFERKGLITAWRAGLYMAGRSRLVFDTAGPVRIGVAKVVPLENGRAQLVLDIARVPREQFVSGRPKAVEEAAVRGPDAVLPKGDRQSVRPETVRPASAKPVIVVDPGHGGLDVGTRSPATGMQEKQVVLEMSRILRDKLEKTGRYEVFVTRDSDTFVPLAERVQFARAHHADVFISIHVDAEYDRLVRGATVYTVAEKGSDDASEALAAKENASDALAGVVADANADQVVDILLDLTRRETLHLNHDLASTLVGGLSTAGRMVKGNGHRSAGFRVLKAYDIPSALVELGFLSNKEDEAMMMSEAWRDKVTTALVGAVDRFFAGRVAGTP